MLRSRAWSAPTIKPQQQSKPTSQNPTPPAALTQSDIDHYVENHLDVSVLAKANRCKDIMCVFQKLMCHKLFRTWNQWQSLLIHRYFWNIQLGSKPSNMVVKHVQLKNTRYRGEDGKWVFALGDMTPEKWQVKDVELRPDLFEREKGSEFEFGSYPTINVFIVEMWKEVKEKGRKRCARDADTNHNSAAWFHNLVMIEQDNTIVCIPFDEQAKAWADELPLERIVRPEAKMDRKIVHRPDYPFLPILWFHVAIQQRKEAQVAKSLEGDIGDVGGVAFFELHMVDALVKQTETMAYLVQFADERTEFAHQHMGRYQVL